jgi:steroid delta-isomerase-like uncharacterized protein
MSEENIATSRRLFEEVWSQGNLNLIDEVCTEDFVDHDPVLGDSDASAIKEAIAGYRQSFPDLEFTIDDIFAADDKVVMRWTGIGTFENEIMGQQPTGEKGEPVHGIAIDRYEGGKIAESWGQWDVMTFLKNIGAVPAEAGAASG